MTQKINSVDVEQFRGTTFFSLTPHRWGNRAKVKNAEAHSAYLDQLRAEIAKSDKPATQNVSADIPSGGKGKAAVSATKRLLISEPLEEMNKFLTEVKTSLCGPFGIAQQSKVMKGLYIVQNDFIQQIEDKIAEAQERLTGETWIDSATGDMRPGYLPAFLDDYSAAIERTRTAPLLDGGLGPLFDSADYPSKDQLREMFSLDSQWLALGIPDDLPPALKAKAAEKFERQMTEAADECKSALRASLGQLLGNLTERLADDPKTGKTKIFRDTLIENVRSFCEVFDARNFLKDDALADLVSKCRAVLDDKTLDADKLRKYSAVRENTKKTFDEIKGQLDTMIETEKSRQFSLADD